MFKKWPLSGMTLTEVLIALVIISILGTFAATTYVKSYEKNLGYRAVTTLRMIRAAERIYYMDWNRYSPSLNPGVCGAHPLFVAGYMQCPNAGNAKERGFDYQITVVGPGTSYIARARRNSLTSRYTTNLISLSVSCCPSETATWGGNWPAEWRPN